MNNEIINFKNKSSKLLYNKIKWVKWVIENFSKKKYYLKLPYSNEYSS